MLVSSDINSACIIIRLKGNLQSHGDHNDKNIMQQDVTPLVQFKKVLMVELKKLICLQFTCHDI